MSKIKFYLEQSWLLLICSFVFGLLIAVTDAGLKLNIQQNEKNKINQMLYELISKAKKFELAVENAQIAVSSTRMVETNIYKALDKNGTTIGFAYIAEGYGFADKIKLVIAVDGGFEKFYGFKVLFSNETPNFGDRIKDKEFNGQFIDAPAGKFILVKANKKSPNEIVAISGATVSSRAVVNIFNSYTDKIKNLLISKGLIKNGG